MKKLSVFICLSFACIFFYTCKKDDPIKSPAPILPIASPTAPDSILYTDISDDSLISPIRPDASMCGVVPTPGDTVFSDSIDIDMDGIYDMKFTDTHYYNPISGSNPCSNYNCKVDVIMKNVSDTIAHGVGSHSWWMDELNINDSINNTLNYNYSGTNTVMINYIYHPFIAPTNNFLGEKYLAFKMYRSGKTMYGWVRIESVDLNGVIIKDFAINKTNGNQILAGHH